MSEVFSYDVMPYPSKFFLQTHPERLASIATFFGLNPPRIETCSVLELGCGNGSNLIAHAFTMPNARFVGVDLAPNHIDDANRMAAELGLTNVAFHQMDVTAMSATDFGTFDYVTAHGLFSWVPDFVRDSVLKLCRDVMNANGIGYISYAAKPGAFQRQMVQQMIRRRVRDIDEPLGKVGEAMSFLSFLSENATERETYAPVLASELRRHFDHDAADIFHDDLSDFNNAFYIEEFDALLRENGLRFLGEAELHAMGTHGLSADARQFADAIADVVEREQYLDFLRGRVFRQTLFCRAELEPNYTPDPSILKNFMLASSIRPVAANFEVASPKREKFVGIKGIGFEIDHPLTKSALVVLGEEWGRALPFSELMALAAKKLGAKPSDADIEVTTAILFQICRSTPLIDMHLFQPVASPELSTKPRVSRLAVQQLASAVNVLTLFNLDVKIEDAVSRRLLELCDGTRDENELAAAMKDFVEKDQELDRDSLPEDLGAWASASLRVLARLGMFEA